MDLHVPFHYRNKAFDCIINIDRSDDPCYVFIMFDNPDLIAKFGDEITIKTDFKNRLPKKDDYTDLIEIRQNIFDAIKNLPEFLMARQQLIKSIAAGALKWKFKKPVLPYFPYALLKQ